MSTAPMESHAVTPHTVLGGGMHTNRIPRTTLLLLCHVLTCLELDGRWLYLEAFGVSRDSAFPRLDPSDPAPGPAEK